MNYAGANFLGVITQHQHVGTLNKAKINKVSCVKFFPFNVSVKYGFILLYGRKTHLKILK